MSAQTQGGAVKITLHSANNDVDEKAEVTVALKNPDEAVSKMLRILAQRFPPESVMTIQPNNGNGANGANGSSVYGESSRHTSASSQRATGTLPRGETSITRKSRGGSKTSPTGATRLPSDNNSVVSRGSRPDVMYAQPGMMMMPNGLMSPMSAHGMIPYIGVSPSHMGMMPNMMPGMMPNGMMANGMMPGGMANGMMPNGMMPNGMMPNGMMANSMMPNGMMANGMMPSGMASGMMPNGMMANGVMPNGMMANGMMPNGMNDSGMNDSGMMRNRMNDGGMTPDGMTPSGTNGRPMMPSGMASGSMNSNNMMSNAMMPNAMMPSGTQSMAANNGMRLMPNLPPGFGEHTEILPDGSRVRYVEVDVHEERTVEVPRVEVREVVKEVKVPEYVTHTVEVDDVQVEEVVTYEDKVTEEEREVKVPVKITKEQQVEHVVQKFVDVHTTREEIVEVPEIIEIEKPYTVEQPMTVPRYNQKQVPCMVAQLLNPTLRTEGKMKVATTTYEPVLYAVDVYIPKPVTNAILSGGKIGETHQQVNVPAAQYNSLVHKLNPSLEQNVINEVCLKTVEGHVPLLPAGELAAIVTPHPGAWENPSQPKIIPRGSAYPEKKRSHKKSKKHHHRSK